MKQHKHFMKQARSVNSSVGAVLVWNNYIVAYGYWGADPHRCSNPVVHAEDMAITRARKTHSECNGMILYTTKFPCLRCARIIIEAGIRTVYYETEYLHSYGGKTSSEILEEASVICTQI